MSPECEAFLQAVLAAQGFAGGELVGHPDWETTFMRLNQLSMYEMLRALAALDPLDLADLWAHHAASTGRVNMPRIEFAYNVVHDRHLPGTIPADVLGARQMGDARDFLANPSPLQFDRDLTSTVPAPKAKPAGLGEPDYVAASAKVHVEVSALQAVAQVEAGGRAGFAKDGRPMIRYELHIFRNGGGFNCAYHGTGGIYDRTHPHLSQSSLAAGDRFHDGTQATEWSLMYGAMMLREARGNRRTADAWQSASWGMFQVMGFNYGVDWRDIDDFVGNMFDSEAQHLRAFLAYVRANRLENTLTKHDWAGFARGYNGADYAANHYDQRIANAYTTIRANRQQHGLPL